MREIRCGWFPDTGEYHDGELFGLVFVAGARGFGKTTEMMRLLLQCHGPWVFYDHNARHHIEGATVVHTPGELKAAMRAHPAGFHVVYQPIAGDLVDQFRKVCHIVKTVAGMIFAVDEIDAYCSAKYGDSRMPPELYNLIHYGRHAGKDTARRGVSMVYSARLPKSAAPALRGQAHEMRLFHEQEPDNVDYFAKVIGEDTAARLNSLPLYKFLLWHNDGSAPVIVGGKR